MDEKDQYFVVVTFSTGTKQADFLGIFLNLMKKKIYFVNGGMILDSVQNGTLKVPLPAYLLGFKNKEETTFNGFESRYTELWFCNNCWVNFLVFVAYVKILQNQTFHTDGDFEFSLCPR